MRKGESVSRCNGHNHKVQRVLEHLNRIASTSVYAKNFPFCTSKTYFFYFTHLFLQNTHINLSIIHIYSNKIFISLLHRHRPTPTIHTGITQESTQPTGRKPEKQTQQNKSKPTYQD